MISCVTPVILMSICSAVTPEPGAGDLEVHVAEVILGALDVGEDDVIVALLDQPHGDARQRDACIFTPAASSARVEAHTDPIEEEPFDSSVSETSRIVYGNSVSSGIIGSSDRCARLPWPMSRRFGPAHEAGLADREGREVVVVDEPALLLEREVVDPLALLRGAEREQASGSASGLA